MATKKTVKDLPAGKKSGAVKGGSGDPHVKGR